MDNVGRTSRRLGRWPIIAGFALGAIILAIAAGASAWQESVHRSDVAAMEENAATASLLQDAEEHAGIAAEMLQAYVINGDATLIPEIQTHASAGIESLTGAVAQGGAADLNEIMAGGSRLAEGSGQIIALRQSGNVQGAATALEQVAPAFDEFTLGIESAIALELDEASALQSSADRADNAASWLLIVSVATGAVLALAASALIARSIIGRRVPKRATPV